MQSLRAVNNSHASALHFDKKTKVRPRRVTERPPPVPDGGIYTGFMPWLAASGYRVQTAPFFLWGYLHVPRKTKSKVVIRGNDTRFLLHSQTHSGGGIWTGTPPHALEVSQNLPPTPHTQFINSIQAALAEHWEITQQMDNFSRVLGRRLKESFQSWKGGWGFCRCSSKLTNFTWWEAFFFLPISCHNKRIRNTFCVTAHSTAANG